MTDTRKRHLVKQLPLDHGHPDVWCPFSNDRSTGAYDSKKHIIVFELWQANCDDCIRAREEARGSYSFDGTERQPDVTSTVPLTVSTITKQEIDEALELGSLAIAADAEYRSNRYDPEKGGPALAKLNKARHAVRDRRLARDWHEYALKLKAALIEERGLAWDERLFPEPRWEGP